MTIKQVIHSQVLAHREALAEAFGSARFFPHVVIDDFLTAETCRGLLEEFPEFRDENALNELGEIGHKAYFEDVRRIGQSYSRLDRCVRSVEFLELMSQITGIPDLIYDPDYSGGGTHENTDGAELDPHIDFNYHPNMKWHRRLNLIVFLNPEWEARWGGCFEVHRNPRSLRDNELERIVPLLNRAVIFETTEISWHGFNKITLPADHKHLSRKSFALYLYSNGRPSEEIAPAHATIYAPRPLPRRFLDGSLLEPDDTMGLATAIARRDQQIEFLYGREKELSERLGKLISIVRERIPLKGYVHQIGEATGLWEDLWAGREISIRFVCERPVSRIVVEGFVPDFLPSERQITAEIDDTTLRTDLCRGPFSWPLKAALEKDQAYDIRLVCSETWNPHREGFSPDARDLGFFLTSMTFY